MSEAPSRSERKACWESRDAYFECLTKSGEQEASCTKDRAAFEKNCAASWVGLAPTSATPRPECAEPIQMQVDYFVKRRILQKRQDAMYAQDAGNIANAATSPSSPLAGTSPKSR